MDSFHHSRHLANIVPFGCISLISLLAFGCASPGPPRSPSLNLPEPVRDLSVTRIGNSVEIHFTAPSRTTDKLPIKAATVSGQICRQIGTSPCLPVPASRTSILNSFSDGTPHLITWTDPLPQDIAQGQPQTLAYRVEFFSPAGRSAGLSNPAFTAAGPPASPVQDLRATGSRLGVILTWNATNQPGEVRLKREDLAFQASKPGPQTKPSKESSRTTVWLAASPLNDTSHAAQMLDSSALPDTPYRYVAQRRVSLELGNKSIEILSEPSAPVTYTLHEVYPPPTPAGLTAVGYFSKPSLPDSPPPFAVDLIWQPIDNAGLTAGLTGYNVYREAIDPTTDPRDRLNTAPLQTPGFHDPSADSALRYRYSVTAVDTKGNESPPVTVILEPSSKH